MHLKAPPIAADALLQLGSFNEKTLEFAMRIYSGAVVQQIDWSNYDLEIYDLVFDLAPEAVRLGYLNSGRAPFLKDHRYGTDYILGGIKAGAQQLTAEGLVGVGFWSPRESLKEPREDFARGIGTNLSMGARILRAIEEVREGNQRRFLRAVEWEPFEVSRVIVGADPNACALALQRDTAAAALGISLLSDCTVELITPAKHYVMTKPIDPAATSGATAPAAAPDAAALEAQRLAGIEEGKRQQAEFEREARTVCTKLRLSDVQTSEVLAKASGDLGKARELAVNLRAAQDDESVSLSPIRVTRDQRETSLQGLGTAILARLNPAEKLDDNARRFRGFTILDMARHVLQLRGVPIEGKSKYEIARLAFMTSEDLVNVFDNSMRKRLLSAYEAEIATYQPWAARSDKPDFKKMKSVRISEAPSLSKVGKGGEVKAGAFSDSAETWGIEENAVLVHFTREMMINDDLGALNRGLAMFGGAARRMELDTVYSLLQANPVMSDGNAYFHASHSNLGTEALDEAGLNARWKAMTTQKGIGGKQYLGLMPKFLIVPPSLRLTALRLMADITAAKSTDVNPFSGTLQVIVEPRLETEPTKWYLAASPMQVPSFEYGFLEGENPPITETFVNAEHLGLSFRIIESFGAAGVDWTGMQKSGT